MKQNKKLGRWFVLLAILTACFVTLLVLLLNTPVLGGKPTGPANLAEALAPQRSTLLESGDTLQLDVPEKLMSEEVTFKSSDEKVVTVDATGLVTSVGKGMAFVTVSDSDESVVCGFIVDGQGSVIDITKLSAKEVFSNLKLHTTTEITGMAVDAKNQAVYLVQSYGHSSYVPLNSDIMISKVEMKSDAWELSSWMRFTASGKGTISLDNGRLWMECGGDNIGYGKSISLIDWTDNAYHQDSYGTVFQPQGISGGMTVTADPENDMVLVYDRSAKCYRVYNRADMLAGEENPEYLHAFSCKANQTPAAGVDDSKGRYNASIRGYALHDGYLYQISGSSTIYLSVFDLEGNLQYCHRITDYPELDYRMPASISVVDGKVYVAVASGSSEYVLANVWVFE